MLAAREIQSGAFALGADASHLDRPMTLYLGWRVRSLRTLARDGIELEGEMHAPGFADHQCARGRLTMPARGRLRYQVEFTTNENEPHRFDGERKLSLKGLPVALTVLRGQITSGDGKSVGRALLRFDLRNELPRFLRSIEYRP